MKKQLLIGAFILGAFFTANAQLSESFEGGTTIPTGWTVINEGDTNTWTVVDLSGSTLTAQEGTNIVAIGYSATAHNDYLVTPSITVTDGVSDVLSFWGRSRDEDYPETIAVKISTTTPTADAFTTTLMPNVAPASGPNFHQFTYDLSAYEGQTVYIGFHSTTTDMFYFDIDNVQVGDGSAITTCGVPTAFTIVEPNPTPTTFNIGWTAPSVGTPVGYEFEYAPAPYTQGGAGGTTLTPTTNVVNLTDLTPSTDYHFYIRTNCGDGDYSEWVGPILFNSVYQPTIPPYSHGFETLSLAGWAAPAPATGPAWDVIAGSEDIPAQEGDNLAIANVGTGASNAWLFSRGFNVTATSPVTVTYYIRKVVLAGTGLNANNLQVTWGNQPTAAAQTNVLSATTAITNTDEYVQVTHNFEAPTTGTYYIGFNHTAAGHTQTEFSILALDGFEVTAILGTNDVLSSQFSVYPNPATNVINIANAENILVNGVEIVDINGRTVKTVKFDNVSEAQINISDLSAGMYLMNISSDKGTTTKKIVKN